MAAIPRSAIANALLLVASVGIGAWILASNRSESASETHSTARPATLPGAGEAAPTGDASAPSPLAPMADATRALDTLHARKGTYNEEKDKERLIQLKDWDDFYGVARTSIASGEHLEFLIVRRVEVHGGLSDSQRKLLKKLIDTENAQCTEQAITKYGSQQSLYDWSRSSGAKAAAFWNDLAALRKSVRSRHDEEYRQSFNPEQLKLINEHLRSEEIRLISWQEGGKYRCRIGGLGRSDPAH
jgi:hypothetical protein